MSRSSSGTRAPSSRQRRPRARAAPLPRRTESPAPALARFPAALAHHHRLGLFPPLRLLADLLDLTAGTAVPRPWAAELARHDGIQELVRLRWPAPARVGLAALLIHCLPLRGWEPPRGATPSQVRDALHQALSDSEPVEPTPIDIPTTALTNAANAIDDRLLTLLAILGPDAVADDPGLPLRLLPRLDQLPALTEPRRRLVGLRFRLGDDGPASGSGPGSQRTGVDTTGDLRSLLPSQWALPPQVLAFRHERGELLYRARAGSEPPRLRPVVLLLDVSPPAFGPVEAVTRPAADAVARSLIEARVPAALVTTGSRQGGEVVRMLEAASDLVEIWAERSLEPADAGRSLRLAGALRRQLGDGATEAVVLLLSHAWFGSEERVPVVPQLRGLFVQYPGRSVRPALSGSCQRWESVASGHRADLSRVLAGLIG